MGEYLAKLSVQRERKKDRGAKKNFFLFFFWILPFYASAFVSCNIPFWCKCGNYDSIVVCVCSNFGCFPRRLCCAICASEWCDLSHKNCREDSASSMELLGMLRSLKRFGLLLNVCRWCFLVPHLHRRLHLLLLASGTCPRRLLCPGPRHCPGVHRLSGSQPIISCGPVTRLLVIGWLTLSRCPYSFACLVRCSPLCFTRPFACAPPWF